MVKIEINFTNRWLYSFIVFIGILVLSIGVYAVSHPNPGHTAGEIGGNPLTLTGAAPIINLLESDQTLPAGVWRIAVDADGFIIDRNSASAGDYSTYNRIFRIDSSSNTFFSGNVLATTFEGDGSALSNIVVKVSGGDTCDSSNDGLLRYQSGLCSRDNFRASSFDICVRTSDSGYDWQNVQTNEWGDVSCSSSGCPVGQQWYECTGDIWPPGCYASEPALCFFSCFLEGTGILMADGTYKNIEDFEGGELVASYDTENNLKTTSRVEYPLEHENVDGYVLINGELEVTSNHRMWIVNRQEWGQVRTIELGEVLLGSDGQEVTVSSLENIEGVNTVYNLELEGEYHNYFAGDILVHNVK